MAADEQGEPPRLALWTAKPHAMATQVARCAGQVNQPLTRVVNHEGMVRVFNANEWDLSIGDFEPISMGQAHGRQCRGGELASSPASL